MTDQNNQLDGEMYGREQFDADIQRVIDLQRDIAVVDLEINERINDAEQDRARRTESMREETAEVLPRVWGYVDEHPELFEDGHEVSFVGAVMTRTPGTRSTILDMQKLVKAARDIGESALVEIVETVSVSAINAKKGVLDKLLKRDPQAIRSDRYWNFKLSFKPKETKSEKGALPKPLKHDLLRQDPLSPDNS